MVAVHRQRNGFFIGRNIAAPGEETVVRFVEDDRFNRQLLPFTECACIWEDFLIAAIDAHRCIGHWVIGSDLQHNHIIAIDFQLANLHQVAVCLIRQAELRAHYADIASLNRLVKQNGARFAGDRVSLHLLDRRPFVSVHRNQDFIIHRHHSAVEIIRRIQQDLLDGAYASQIHLDPFRAVFCLISARHGTPAVGIGAVHQPGDLPAVRLIGTGRGHCCAGGSAHIFIGRVHHLNGGRRTVGLAQMERLIDGLQRAFFEGKVLLAFHICSRTVEPSQKGKALGIGVPKHVVLRGHGHIADHRNVKMECDFVHGCGIKGNLQKAVLYVCFCLHPIHSQAECCEIHIGWNKQPHRKLRSGAAFHGKLYVSILWIAGCLLQNCLPAAGSKRQAIVRILQHIQAALGIGHILVSQCFPHAFAATHRAAPGCFIGTHVQGIAGHTTAGIGAKATVAALACAHAIEQNLLGQFQPFHILCIAEQFHGGDIGINDSARFCPFRALIPVVVHIRLRHAGADIFLHALYRIIEVLLLMGSAVEPQDAACGRQRGVRLEF